MSVFLLFISFHPSVPPCLIGHQQDKKKKEKVMIESGNSIVSLLSNFLAASFHYVSAGSYSLCHNRMKRL